MWYVDLLPEAEVELTALPKDMRARFLHIAEMLGEFGPQCVGMPHVRPPEGKLATLKKRLLTEKMQTTQSTIARTESGRTLPSMRTLSRYAEATGNRAAVRLEAV